MKEMGAIDIEVQGNSLPGFASFSCLVFYGDMLQFQKLSTEEGCIGAEGATLGQCIDFLFCTLGIGNKYITVSNQMQAVLVTKELFVINTSLYDDSGLLSIGNGIQCFLDAAVVPLSGLVDCQCVHITIVYQLTKIRQMERGIVFSLSASCIKKEELLCLQYET